MNESVDLTGGASAGHHVSARSIQGGIPASRSVVSLQEREGQSGDQPPTSPGTRNATSVADLTCTDVRSQLNELLDGSLDLPSRQRLERHLEQCSDCGALWRTLQQTKHALGDLNPVSRPVGMRDRLRQRLREQPPQ